MNPQHAEALRLADDLDAMGRSKDMGRPAIQDIERRAAAMLRALAAPHAGAAPDGWKLVPVEPTEEMVVHGFESRPSIWFSTEEAWAEFEAMTGCQQAAHCARLCWAAMLSASPAAPAPCATRELMGLSRAELNALADKYAAGNGLVLPVEFAAAAIRAFCQKNKLPEPRP